jgi:hypothetical protein
MIRARPLRTLLIAAALLLLAGCATSHVLTGQPRPPIDPAQVHVYFDPPPGYQEIARLQTSSGAFAFGDQAKLEGVLRNLRAEAARLGANGVLVLDTADGYGGTGVSVGGGGGRYGGRSYSGAGVGVTISPTRKHARAIAIHVPGPPPR